MAGIAVRVATAVDPIKPRPRCAAERVSPRPRRSFPPATAVSVATCAASRIHAICRSAGNSHAAKFCQCVSKVPLRQDPHFCSARTQAASVTVLLATVSNADRWIFIGATRHSMEPVFFFVNHACGLTLLQRHRVPAASESRSDPARAT